MLLLLVDFFFSLLQTLDSNSITHQSDLMNHYSSFVNGPLESITAEGAGIVHPGEKETQG